MSGFPPGSCQKTIVGYDCSSGSGTGVGIHPVNPIKGRCQSPKYENGF